MQPFIPRRRSRRRSVSGRLVLLICALVVVALVVGGITQIDRQSGPYDASVNRSFAALGAVVIDQSNVTGSQVQHLMATIADEDRGVLQADLDNLVQQSGLQAGRAQAITAPAPAAAVATAFAAVFTERATAVRDLRDSIDGLLGMHPLVVAGSPRAATHRAPSPTLLSSVDAADRITAAGALLIRADGGLQSVRHSLAKLAGHAGLPASTWVRDTQLWQAGAVAAQVDLMAVSPTLVATHRLVLRAVRLSPEPLPPTVSIPAGTAELSPTTSLTVSVVVADAGTVDEPHAVVRFTLTDLASGVAETRSRSAPVVSTGSVAMAPVTFSVHPGHTYQLSVAVVLPAAQTDSTQTSLADNLQIAPST